MKALLLLPLVLLASCAAPKKPKAVTLPLAVGVAEEATDDALQNAQAISKVKRDLDDAANSVHELGQLVEEQNELINELESLSSEERISLTDSKQKVKVAYEFVVKKLQSTLLLLAEAEKNADELAEKVAKKDQEARLRREREIALETKVQEREDEKNQLKKDLVECQDLNRTLKPYRTIVFCILGAIALFIFLRYVLPPLLRVLGKTINPLS